MDSVDNFVVPKQNPVGLEGPMMELGLHFTCKDMEKDVRWTVGRRRTPRIWVSFCRAGNMAV